MECKMEAQSSNLLELKKITSTLDFARFSNPHGNIVELDMDRGLGYMIGLMKQANIAVAKNSASKDSLFPVHAHDVWELLVVYEGEMHLKIKDKVKVLGVKDFYYIEPGVSHSAYFPKDCWFLAITMPAAEDWPEGRSL